MSPGRRFAHRLALAVGEADVPGLMAALPQRLWLDWYAYFEVEPWGEDRADLRSAIVAATQFNTTRARGQAARPPRDFMAHPPPRKDVTKAHTAALMAALRPLARPKHADPK